MFDAAIAVGPSNAGLYAGKTLADRAAGRFYTPDILGLDLAVRLADSLASRASRGRLGAVVRVCDPFCGDGRLLVALLVEIATRPMLHGRRWSVFLQDIERAAVRRAQEAVAVAASALGLDVEIRSAVGDSFAGRKAGLHDAVITNPPWELVKPDTRELAHLTPTEQAAHIGRLRSLSDSLDARYPSARADKAWGGWGTNLARCGWDHALQSCVPGGVLGIVLPSTIFADQASATMRASALTRSRLVDIAAFPSEARLFDRVDQPVVAATFVLEPTADCDAALRLFGADRTERARCAIRATRAELVASGYVLPIGFGAEAAELLKPVLAFPRMIDLEGPSAENLWAGRELDETRILEKTRNGVRHPFVKGRMVQRFGFADRPACSVLPELAKGFKSSGFERVAWRDVSRASQRRRMIGTIIPPGWVAGNSLHVAHFRDGNPERLRALLAVLSSFVLEFQVRSRLATGHMSLGVVRTAHVPEMKGRTLSRLAALANSALVLGNGAAPNIEVAVARAYGLGRDEMAAIIGHFPKVDAAEREAVLAPTLWKGGRS